MVEVGIRGGNKIGSLCLSLRQTIDNGTAKGGAAWSASQHECVVGFWRYQNNPSYAVGQVSTDRNQKARGIQMVCGREKWLMVPVGVWFVVSTSY